MPFAFLAKAALKSAVKKKAKDVAVKKVAGKVAGKTGGGEAVGKIKIGPDSDTGLTSSPGPVTFKGLGSSGQFTNK